MINVSSDFKTAASAPVRTIQASIVVDPFGSTPLTISSSTNLVSFTIESSGELFGSASSIATVKLLGSDYDLLGKTIRIMFGLLVNNVYEQLDYGYYKVTESPIKKGAETTTIKAINMMGVMQEQSYESGITYPITIASLATAIGDRFELTVSDMTNLPNVNYQILEDLYANISETNYRNILAEIAGATATMATIDDRTRTIYFRPYQTNVQGILTYDNLKSLTVGASYGPVNSVVLSRTPQEDNIAVTNQTSVELNGLTEVKLANNEIMDDNRVYFAADLLDAVDGIEWTGFEATTVGHGWYEVGDRISFTDSNNTTWEGVITYHSLTVDGGVKETIKGVVPTETTTNYALAGNVMRTIYNTEIKVDKQNRQIQSIVQEQTSFENQTATNFSNVTQNITSVVASVQNSGGNNLIRNSAMYAKGSNNLPASWELSGSGTWSISPSADASANGSLSGQVISLADKTVAQVITVKADNDSIPEPDKTYYSFSCKIKKTAVGTCSVSLTDGTQEGVWAIELANGESSNYGEFAIEAILPHSSELTLSVTASADALFYITDMMLAVGNLRSQWTQANGEFANSQVQIDIDGISVKNSNLNGTYAKITAQEVELYRNNSLKAVVSSDTIEAPVGVFEDEIDMPPLKVVSQSDGWAFVERSNQ